MLTKSLYQQPIWGCLIVLLLLLAYPSFGQENKGFTVKGGSSLPNNLARLYRMDAARMVLRQYDDLSNAPIRINEQQIEQYFSLLMRIYEIDEIAKSLARCNVHTSPFPSTNYLEMVYDPNMDWAEPLTRGHTTTRNSQINSIVEANELVLETKTNARGESLLIFRAVEPLNMAALARELGNVPGMKPLEPNNHPIVAFSDIQIQRLGDIWEVTYRLFFNEDQIQQQHSWIYQVDDKGNVSLFSESGAPIPEGLGCY